MAGYESDPGRGTGHSRTMSTPGGGIGLGNAKGWGFEFLDHAAPDPNNTSGNNEPQSTHAEFNKMLVSLCDSDYIL